MCISDTGHKLSILVGSNDAHVGGPTTELKFESQAGHLNAGPRTFKFIFYTFKNMTN